MKSGTWTLILVVVVTGAVGFLVGQLMAPQARPSSRSDETETVELEEYRRLEVDLANVTSLLEEAKTHAQSAELQFTSDLAAADAKTARAEARLESATEPEDAGTPPDVSERRLSLSVGATLDPMLSRVDWDSVGEHMGALIPVIGRISEAIANGESPSAEDAGAAQQHNGPLITAGLKVGDDFPGMGVNGKFTHPAFMGNAMSATLAELGLPLSDEQRARLEAVGADFARQDAERIAAYGDGMFELQRVIDEVELRDRYFAAALPILTVDQHLALRPESVRGRVRLDLYSSALIWAGRAGVWTVEDRADAATKAAQLIERGVPTKNGSREAVNEVATAWANALPAELFSWTPDALDRRGMISGDRTLAAARHFLELLRTVERTLASTDEETAAVRGVGGVRVLVPAEK